jgi:ubiquinone/menaquinone biosynthesis C-methylase UbiE
MKHEIADQWKLYWQTHPSIPSWDYMSEIVVETLRNRCGSFSGKRVLEAGCGTGRVSLEIARTGASVTCIDVSPEAIALTQKMFAASQTPVEAAVASLFALPFKAAEFDVVWNAGVLEHFSESERKDALAELLRVVKPGGVFVTLNPYKFGMVYRLAKFASEKLKRWPYGHEDPIASLERAGAGLPVVASREYSTGFFIVLVESLRASNTLMPALMKLRRLFIHAHRSSFGPVIRSTDRAFSRVFGGYLLVSTFRKHEGAIR